MSDFSIDFQVASDKRIRFGRMPWDEEAIEHPVYRVEVSGDAQDVEPGIADMLTRIREHGRAYAMAKLDPEEIEWLAALTKAGFYVTETSVDPFRVLARYEPGRRFPRLVLREAREEDLDTLVSIASEAFSRGRYHLDPNLPSGSGDRRYAGWVQRAFRDGQLLFTFEDTKANKVLGFYHVRDLGGGTANLALAAIEEGARGAGLGAVMYDQCLEECVKRGFQRVETTISVANTAVMNVFAQLGFLFRDPKIVLHWSSE